MRATDYVPEWADVDGAPATVRNAADTMDLHAFRVEAIVYARDLETAEELANDGSLAMILARARVTEQVMRKIKVKITGMSRGPRTLTYQTARDVALDEQVEVPRWPGMPPGPPLRGTVVSLTSDRAGPAVTLIGG